MALLFHAIIFLKYFVCYRNIYCTLAYYSAGVFYRILELISIKNKLKCITSVILFEYS